MGVLGGRQAVYGQLPVKSRTAAMCTLLRAREEWWVLAVDGRVWA